MDVTDREGHGNGALKAAPECPRAADLYFRGNASALDPTGFPQTPFMRGGGFLVTLFGMALAALLAGYAFMGKGFAYWHLPLRFPVYVGEVVLALGLLAALFNPRVIALAYTSATIWIYSAFALAGLLGTIPYLSEYGVDAARDAVIYVYGLFMLLAAGAIRDRRQIERIATGFGRTLPFFFILTPWTYVLYTFAGTRLPLVPGTDVPMLVMKAGDLAVHTGAGVAFLLVMPSLCWLQRHITWGVVLSLGSLAATIASRGAMLATTAGIALTGALRPRLQRTGRLLLVIVVAICIAAAFDVSITFRETGREISVEGAITGLRSVFEDTSSGPGGSSMAGTKQWRLDWWETIWDEVCSGPYFWTGRGFGENLAFEHGIISWESYVYGARQLRSPHNTHMTILARMGVPGAVLWILLNAVFVRSLWKLRAASRRCHDDLMEGVSVVLLAYWLMFMINTAADVYLEGPQGGIWYWTAMGIGVAAARIGPKITEKAVAEMVTTAESPDAPGRAGEPPVAR